MISLKKKNEAFDILSKYDGDNYYILSLKRDVYVYKNVDLNEFQFEYILKNYNVKPIQINKIVNLAKWYSEKKQNDWKLDFMPEKVLILTLLGETDSFYHCVIQYRQSVPPTTEFLSKNGILNDFFAKDYTKLDLDFSWFDKKLQQINPDFFVMDHQKESAKFLLTRKKCILSLDMGMGKTTVSIISSLMYGNKKVLVICPASIKTNWKTELMRFVDEDSISIIRGFNEMNKPDLLSFLHINENDAKKYKVDDLRKMAIEQGKWNEGKQFTILNFDIIDEFHTNKKNEDSDLLKSDFDIVIIDEAHRLSNNTSNRFKIIRNYLKKANNEYTWLLTGTMLTNDVKNLYNMLSLIENNVTGDYKFFMEHYCSAESILMKGEWNRCWEIWNRGRFTSYSSLKKESKDEFKKFVERFGKHVTVLKDPQNIEELNERIKHLYFRRVKEEIMDTEKIIVPITYELTNEQKNEYDSLWDKYEQEKLLEGKDLSEVKQLVEVSVNRQYVSKIMIPNTISLTEKLLSHDKKVFIVCCYDEELYALRDYFKDKCVIYNGKLTQKQKDDAVEQFNNNPDVKILIGNIMAVGVGINLNKSCNHAIFQNLDFTDASFSQACDRIYRIGSKENAYIYLQYFKNTVSEHVVNIITRKKEISNKLINDKN